MLCLLLIALIAQARLQDPALVMEEVFRASVITVEDGDSVIVRSLAGGESIGIHIAGVDAPELSQSGGGEAKTFLTELLSGKTVTIRLKGTLERLAQVEVDGSDVSVLLIKNGMAWHCPRFARESDLAAAEADARRAKRGLWSRQQPTPPWLHRGAGVCWEQQKPPLKSQRRPDFSGTWTAISPPGRVGQKLTILQDAETLALRHESAEDVLALTYKIEGTTSRAFTTIHGPGDSVAKSRWTDGVWTVDERQWIVRGEEARNVRQRIWLDEDGLLNVETASPRPIGEYDSVVVRYRTSVASR